MANRTRKAAESPKDESATTKTTKAQTFTEAADSFTEAHEQGYIGSSAEAERTGKADKGLSQLSPGILDGSSPAPDARKHVDDSEALKALSAPTEADEADEDQS